MDGETVGAEDDGVAGSTDGLGGDTGEVMVDRGDKVAGVMGEHARSTSAVTVEHGRTTREVTVGQGRTSGDTTGEEASSVPSTPPEAAEVFGAHLAQAERYVALLADTGISHGLIGPREGPRLWERHVLNCAVVSPLLAEDAIVADLGSGAGLPGLVLALMRPDLDMHLVEPLHRRIVWLKAAVAHLGLTNVTLHEARADAVVDTVDADYVTARAVARLDKLGRWAVPLLPRGGHLVALKGESAADELAEDLPRLQRALPGRVTASEVLRCGDGVISEPTHVVRLTVTPAPPRPTARPNRKPGRAKAHRTRQRPTR